MSNRRKFLQQISAAGFLGMLPGSLYSKHNPIPVMIQEGNAEKIWACLLHISMNMWKEKDPVLPFDESVWNDVLEKMAEVGMNMVVMDLGDAVVYQSHPEIAVRNAWPIDRSASR